MSKTWLILDCNNLAYRGYYGIGRMAGGDSGLWTIFGFFYNLSYLQDMFDTKNILFCWDYGKNKRRKLMPEYKANRRKKRKKEAAELEPGITPAWKEVRNQCKLLREKYLPMMGYKNIFYQKGYEADDMIAMCCREITQRGDEGVIVSSDKDMLQCINSFIRFYPPDAKNTGSVNLRSFRKKYEMSPRQWAMVKAIMGCTSDNVGGIKGIGEVRARSYVTGTMHSKFWGDMKQKIESKEGQKIIKRNIPIVTLPFKGAKSVKFSKEKVGRKQWNEMGKLINLPELRSLCYVKPSPQKKVYEVPPNERLVDDGKRW